MDFKVIEEMERVRRLQYLSKYGSCLTPFLSEWNKSCPKCERNRTSPVQSLQDICLRFLVNHSYPGAYSSLPLGLYNSLMQCALITESAAIPDIIQAWPKAYLSVVEILSDHNFQCFLPWRREKFAKVLLLSFLRLMIQEDLKLQILDTRGAIVSDEDDITQICELVNNVRNKESNFEVKQILFDIEISEDLFDQLTEVLILNPELNPDSTSKLQVHLGHFQASEGTMRQGQGIKSYLRKMIACTSSKLESLCVPNTFLKNSGLRKILSELKLPKYQNLVLLNVANNDLDFPNCPMTADLFANCLGDLPQLRSLNLSQNIVTGSLEYIVCNLKNGLLDLRLSGCELNSDDLVYLMNSIHASSLLVVDISENSFDESLSLEKFFAAFSAQMIAVEAEACGIDSDKLTDLVWGFQSFSFLHYLSLVGYWMTIEELCPVVQGLCSCKSLRTVVFSLPVDIEFDVEDVNRVKAMIHPIEQLIMDHGGQFVIQWI